jgi:hypothetical protein
MSEISKIPVVAALAAFDLLIAPILALGDDVPDALSVEWQGKKPCEKLFEGAQVRVARCTFPPWDSARMPFPSVLYCVFSAWWTGAAKRRKGNAKGRYCY